MKIPNIYIRTISSREKISIESIVAQKMHYLKKKEKNILLYTDQSVESISWIYASLLAGKNLFIFSSKMKKVEKSELENSLNSFFLIDEEECQQAKTDALHGSMDQVKNKIIESNITLLTSGTSGKPKKITLGIDDFIFSAKAHGRHFKLNREHIWLCCLPLYHISGLSVITRALFLEQNLAFEENPSPEVLSLWFQSNKIHGISLVELQLKRILSILKQPICKSIQYVLVGGSLVQKDTIKAAIQKNMPIYLTYGSTEACSQIATTPIKRKERSLFQLKVLDIWDIKIAKDKEIFFKRKKAKYYTSTGDMGTIQDDHIEILGRKKDLIISGGVNISPKEIVEKVLSIREIEECFVWGVPDSEWGEKVALAYTTKKDISIQSIKSILEDMLHPYKKPKIFYPMKSLPKNNLGKIDKKAIIEAYSRTSFSSS